MTRDVAVRSFRFVVLSFLFAACAGSGQGPIMPTPISTGILTSGPVPTQPVPQGAVFTVSGVVTEVAAGRSVPLQDVRVEDSYRHVWVKTGEDGSYTISDVSAGYGYMYFAKDGYKSYVQEFTLTGDIRLDVELVRR
jgi:hypothetical protein